MAIWQKVFSRRNWQNEPSTATPLNETNLNVGDAALDTIDDRVIELNNRTNELEGYETAAAQSAAEAAQSESNAEAWAVGQRDGTDVGSSDPTYHNNSKYYSEQSASSANASEDHAEDSEAWAVGQRGGVDVPSTDDTYHNNSKYYAKQASDYSQTASGYADEAEDAIETVRELLVGTTFSVNFTTGELEYTGVAYDFTINTTTGNLMWEVA